MKRIGIMVAICALALIALTTVAQARDNTPMELVDALASGQVEAVFYGNGDQSVTGRIRRSAFGPEQIIIEPGTQFWAQQEGLQGMTTLGWVPIDLSRRAVAYFEVPTACTNLDRPAPTRYDRMAPVWCPEPRMAALTEEIGRSVPPRPVAQLAVWAIANNPTWDEVADYAEGMADADTDEERAEIAAGYRLHAAQLLWHVGIDPAEYRMFAGLGQ